MSGSIRDCSELLEQWPSDRPFSVREALHRFPHLRGDARSYDLLVTEEFLRQLEQGTRVSPSKFLAKHPEASSSLVRRLQNLADLHTRVGLLTPVGDARPVFPGPGETIEGYVLLEELGRGTFSRVYLAADQNAGHRRVAVKLTAYGTNEADFLGPIEHPNLPRILTCKHDVERGLTIICMENIGTRTLLDFIEELHDPEALRTADDWEIRTVRVMQQVAAGLAHAHGRGMLHLDIKPSNILLRDDETAVLIDFNLSAPTALAHNLGFRGTLAYAAPEILEAAKNDDLAAQPVSEASDVYALGVVLYEVLTGHLPWPECTSESIGDAAAEALILRRNCDPRPSVRNHAVSYELDEIVAQALSMAPRDRYPTAREFRDALANYGVLRPTHSRFSRGVLALCVLTVVLGVFFADVPAMYFSPQQLRIGPSPISPGNDVHQWASMVVPPRIDVTGDRSPPRWTDASDAELRRIVHVLETAEFSPVDPIHVASLGYLKLLLEDYRGAAECFRNVVDGGLSDDAGLSCNLGYCYFQAGQIGAAFKALETALTHSPNLPTAMFLRSLVELELSRLTGRPLDTRYFDSLLAADTASSLQLAHTAVSYAEAMEFAHAHPPRDSDSANVYAQRAIELGIDFASPSLKGHQQLVEIRFHSNSAPSLPAPRDTRAARLGLPAAFTLNVEEFLDEIANSHDDVTVRSADTVTLRE